MDEPQYLEELKKLREQLAEAKRGDKCGALDPCKVCLWRMVHVGDFVITAAKEVVGLPWFEDYLKRGSSEAKKLKDAVNAALESGHSVDSHKAKQKENVAGD